MLACRFWAHKTTLRSCSRFFSLDPKKVQTLKKVGFDRPHLKRDQLREQKYAHKIHQVTQSMSEYQEKQKKEINNPEFKALKLMDPILGTLSFTEPTEIQKRAIPLAIRGHNIVASAATGTGKTAAYVLPLLHRVHIKLQEERNMIAKGLCGPRSASPLALIVCPSRELAEQVMEQTVKLAQGLPEMKIMGVYGALRTKSTQTREMEKGVDIIVSTPGRLVTLIKKRSQDQNELTSDEEQAYKDPEEFPEEDDPSEIPSVGVLDVSQVSILVLDEVDRMLDMGHLPEIKSIFHNLTNKTQSQEEEKEKEKKESKRSDLQVMMFTATLMPKVMNLVSRFAPQNQKIDLNWDMQTPVEGTQTSLRLAHAYALVVKAAFYEVHYQRKHALLAYLLRRKGSFKGKKVLIFARTRTRVKNLTELLKNDGFKAVPLHRSQTLSERQRNIDIFRNNEAQILVGTELMARGMDIPDLEVVINYDVPHLPEEYIHRVGRVGRNGVPGTAVTLIAKELQSVRIAQRIVQIDEHAWIKKIESLLAKKIYPSKVPGPWRDDTPVTKTSVDQEEEFYEDEDQDEVVLANHSREVRLREQIEQTKEFLLEKHKRIAQQAKQRKNVKQATPKEKEALQLARRKKVSLRDFEEGRYEDVIQKLEINKLRAQGTVVPEDYANRVKKLEDEKLQEREMRKAGTTPKKLDTKPKDHVLRYIKRGQKNKKGPRFQ